MKRLTWTLGREEARVVPDAGQQYSCLPVKPCKVSQIALCRLLPTGYIVALFKRGNIKNLSLEITWKNITRAHAKLKPQVHNLNFVLLSHTLGHIFGAISVETPVLRASLTQHLGSVLFGDNGTHVWHQARAQPVAKTSP